MGCLERFMDVGRIKVRGVSSTSEGVVYFFFWGGMGTLQEKQNRIRIMTWRVWWYQNWTRQSQQTQTSGQ